MRLLSCKLKAVIQEAAPDEEPEMEVLEDMAELLGDSEHEMAVKLTIADLAASEDFGYHCQ